MFPSLHRSLHRFVRHLVRMVFFTWYQVPFYLWWMEPVLKLRKIPKSYAHDFLKIFHLLFPCFIMIEISERNAILGQVRKVIRKTTINRSWKPSNVYFWSKSNMPNRNFTKLLNLELFAIQLLYLCCKASKSFWVYEKCQHIEVKKGTGKVMRKHLCLQTILCKRFLEILKNQAKLNMISFTSSEWNRL